MANQPKTLVLLSLCLAVGISACKQKNTEQQPQQPAAIPDAVVKSAPVPERQVNAAPTAKQEAEHQVLPTTSTTFDINSVPISARPASPFPFLDWPRGLPQNAREEFTLEDDQIYFIVGRELKPVEGRYMKRTFKISELKTSPFAVKKNYANALGELGAVKVSRAAIDDSDLEEGVGGRSKVEEKLRVPGYSDRSYTTYLLRTEKGNFWFGIYTDSTCAVIITVEEKPLTQEVFATPRISAKDMQEELNKIGHIALYLNFDVDRATIRDDGKQTVAEILKLMKQDPTLKLSVEGHTDSTGDAGHNKELSLQRATSVVQALTSMGIDKGRLSAVGFGPERPIADNGAEDGRAKNRRVELVKV